jgi:hypothetical protein
VRLAVFADKMRIGAPVRKGGNAHPEAAFPLVACVVHRRGFGEPVFKPIKNEADQASVHGFGRTRIGHQGAGEWQLWDVARELLRARPVLIAETFGAFLDASAASRTTSRWAPWRREPSARVRARAGPAALSWSFRWG